MTSGLQKKILFSLLDLRTFFALGQHHNKYKMISMREVSFWLVRVVKFPIFQLENSEKLTIFLGEFDNSFVNRWQIFLLISGNCTTLVDSQKVLSEVHLWAAMQDL